MLLYLVKYTLKGNDKGAHLKHDHIDYLKKLYDEGTLLTAGLFIGNPRLPILLCVLFVRAVWHLTKVFRMR